MLPIVDANVILRYLLEDNKAHFKEARRVIDAGCETTVEVLAEVVYVLQGAYQVPRSEIATSLRRLLDVVYAERSDEIDHALELFATTTLDFIDCILIAANQVSGRTVISFDKKVVNRIIS